MAIASLPALLAFGHIGDGQDPAYIVGPGFFDSENGNMRIVTLSGLRFLQCFEHSGNPSARVGIPGATRYVLGLRLAANSGGIATPWISLYSSGTRNFGLNVLSDGRLSINRGSSSIATDDTHDYQDGTPRYVEIAVFLDDSDGEVQVRVDGAEVINVSGLDTRTTATAVDQLRLQGGNTFPSGEWIAAGDVYLKEWDSPTNPGFLGEMAATEVALDGDVAVEWSPDSGGTNYTQVDETDIDDDTTYVEDSTDGDVDEYSHGGAPGVPEIVYAVTQYSVGKLVSGSPTVQHGLDDGSNESYGTALAHGAAYGTAWTHQLTAPDGGGWTESKVDACNLLLQHNTTDPARVTKVGAYVWEQVNPSVDKPSIINAVETAVGALLEGSTYSGTPGSELQSATWRVYSDAAGATLVYELEVDYGDAHPTDPEHLAQGGMLPGTNYWATVEYENTNGETSAVSDFFPFTTLAADPPDAPSIVTVDEVAEDSARFTLSAYSHPDEDGLVEPQPWSHKASRLQIDVQSGSFGAPLLEAEWFGGVYPLDMFHTQDVLDPAVVYKARAAVQDNRGNWSVWGPEKQFQTLDGSTTRPAAPTVTIDTTTAEGEVTAHTSAFSAGDGGSHDATRWVVEDSGGDVIYDQIVDAGDLINVAVTVPPGASCLYAYHREDNGVWSARSSCEDVSIPAGGGFWFPVFTNPLDAHLLEGTVDITYELQNDQELDAGAHFELSISQDMGVTWTTLTDDDKTGSFELDTTLYDDVPTLLRVRVHLDDPGVSFTTWTTLITGIKNDAAWDLEITEDIMNTDGGLDAFDGRYWHDSSAHGMFGPEDVDYGIARQNQGGSTGGMMVFRRTASRVLRSGTVMGRIMMDGPSKAGFPWQHGYWLEYLFGGIASNVTGRASLGETLSGIAVHIHMFPVSLGPIFGTPANVGAGRITIEVRESGVIHSRSTNDDQNLWGKLEFAHGLWYGLGTSGTYDEIPDREPWYGIAMNVNLSDNGDGTDDLRVRVRLTGAWAHYLDPLLDEDGWHMDETFTNVVLPCGEPGFCGNQTSARFGSFNGWVWYEAMAVQVDEEDECGGCPEPPDCTGTPNTTGGATITGSSIAA